MKVWILFVVFVSLLPLSACGVRPRDLDAPEGARQNVEFPRTYPARDQ